VRHLVFLLVKMKKTCPRKSCIHQQKEQLIDNFTKECYRKDGLCIICKDCRHAEYEKDQERIKTKSKQRYYEDVEKGIKPKPSPNKAINDRKYYDKNKEKIIAYTTARTRIRRQNNIQVKLACNLRRRLQHALKGNFKAGSAVLDLCCSISDFKVWLEQQFYCNPKTGEQMTWSNHGKLWHIDHIVPLSSVDLIDRKQLLKVCHWFNLRPRWAYQNIGESDRGMSRNRKIVT